jgi:ParB-like chromosome segregation protein Spo0J
MTDMTSIPLNELVASEDNVRRAAGADTALHELASSLAAHGLLQEPAAVTLHGGVCEGESR